MDEFDAIARLFRPLTGGAPEALDLLDDAAAIPARPGFDLIVTKDAMVAGVHFLPDDPPDLIARKLLRVNLSDLAAKAAEPYAYFLAAAWPNGWGEAERAGFAKGLAKEQARFGLRLLGGDTVSTPGPLTLSATLLGYAPAGRMVRRGGARAGDVVLVSGTIGDGWLGLMAAQGKLLDDARTLATRYQLPEPRLLLRSALLAHATAAADVSDGLIADAGHIGKASKLRVELNLDRLPLSTAASRWMAAQPDRVEALSALASGGDDYELVLTAPPGQVTAISDMAAEAAVPLTPVGRMVEGEGTSVLIDGQLHRPARAGWTHG